MIGRHHFLRRVLASAAVAAAMAGCGDVVRVQAPAGCFPEGAALAFAGKSTLAALGLADGSNFDPAIGRIYVSRDKLPYPGSIPDVPAGVNPVVIPDHRQYCAIYPDDVIAIGGVPDDWSPPAR